MWTKLGRVFAPDGEQPWMLSHASNPVPQILGETRCRIFFAARDAQNRSSIAFLEIDLDRPRRILRLAARPALSPGVRGGFDDSGTTPACLVELDGRLAMFYVGWTLGQTVPFRNSIGLAWWDEATATFERAGVAPILDRDETDPLTLSYPFVLREVDGYRMWYGSHLSWDGAGGMVHVIRHATSPDGFDWQRDAHPVLPFAGADEYAFSRPCVVRGPEGYRMWYSFRGAAYRIGCAVSPDGRTWRRADQEAGIAPGPEEWDGETVEYPFVFGCANRQWLLYNGNGYGRTGFGLAVWDR